MNFMTLQKSSKTSFKIDPSSQRLAGFWGMFSTSFKDEKLLSSGRCGISVFVLCKDAGGRQKISKGRHRPLRPALGIPAVDSRKMNKSLMGTTTNKEEVVSVDQMLSADFVSLVKSAMSNSQSDPFNMPIGALIKVLRKNSHDAMQLLQDENSEVLEFYWECTRTGWVYKYLNGHHNEFFSGFAEVRELLLCALTKSPSAEHKFAIETAIAKLPNPYQPLISHLQKNPQVQHVKDLSFYLVELLGVAASVDAIQSPPDLKQRVNTLYEEVKLRSRILIFLNSEAAEVTAEVEEDAKQSVDMAVHLDLTDQQVKSLKSLLSN